MTTQPLFCRAILVKAGLLLLLLATTGSAAEPAPPTWKWSPELLRPFWQGTVVAGESVLFIKDSATGEARASVLFPVTELHFVRNSAGDVTYEEGRDYRWQAGSHEIVLPATSRIPSRTPQELRRPAKSQPYELTHRDGNGEIYFGGKLEYAEMQTCLTYAHAPVSGKIADLPLPRFDRKALPRTVERLASKEPLSIVVLGDSISAGANASGLYNLPPLQPAYPELVRQNLGGHFGSQVTLTNLSVGGKDTAWGQTQIDAVVAAQPHLVILAFGMNDSAGRTAPDYQDRTRQTIAGIREQLPETEFVLVASMLGNPDWVRLQQELFPAYRDALAELCGPGVALADLTTIWKMFLTLKRDWDQTGNGVNHPNDFGHRVYAQVLCALLIPEPHDSLRQRRDSHVTDE